MHRSRLLSLFTVIAIITLSGAGIFSVSDPPVARAASSCGCAGDYVNPAAKSPAVSKPKEGSTSPKGTYALAITSTTLTVTDAKSGNTVLHLTGLTSDFHAGFSPNDSGFAVWAVGSAGSSVDLYDLSAATPSHVVWSNSYLTDVALGFSPHGKYFLVSASANSQFTQVTAINATSGDTGYNDQVSANTHWGFSPDDSRLALWTGVNNATTGNSTTTVILYDLSAHRQVWRADGAYGGVSVAFSPHGVYFATAAISNGSHADLAVVPAAAGTNTLVYQNSFTLYAPSGKGKDTFGSAAWGFGPSKEDSSFVYDAVDGQDGADVVLVNLTTGASHPFAYPSLVSGWWQYSPCGDVLGVVIQPQQTASVDVSLYDTGSGQALTTQQFSSLNVSLKATEAYHVVTVDGTTDHKLVKNAGHADCSNSGGNGSSNGNGSGGNRKNGGEMVAGAGRFRCPSCYSPIVNISDLQISPIAVLGGSQATGTLSTTTGGAVSLTSSDPTIASVPATVNTVSGTNTFTIATSAVDQDTLVTITAKAGDSTKTARLVVAAACSTANPTMSASVVAAAPIAGNGGGNGGPRGGGIERPVARVSVLTMVVTGGGTTTGTIALSVAPKQDATFTITASDAAAVTVPSTVMVPKGQKTATFSITANSVAADEFVTIGARSPGYLSLPGTLAVMQAPALDSLTLDATSVEGGNNVTGTVTLAGGGIGCQAETIDLTSSNDGVAQVPDSVTIPAGSSSATFNVVTNAVTSDVAITIEGSLNGITQSANLTVKAPAPPTGVYNDNFADAANLDIPGGAIGDTNLATMESGEPILSGTCAVLTASCWKTASGSSSRRIRPAFSPSARQTRAPISTACWRSTTTPDRVESATSARRLAATTTVMRCEARTVTTSTGHCTTRSTRDQTLEPWVVCRPGPPSCT